MGLPRQRHGVALQAPVSDVQDQVPGGNVPLVNTMIDTGFKAAEGYRFCLATGWKAMKGDDAEWVLSPDARSGKTVRRVWRRVLVDPSLGTRKARVRRHLSRFQWFNLSIKDHLALFINGVVGQWTIPKKAGRDYVEQMTAEVREERDDSRGRIKVLWVQKRRDNHYLDCELMIHVAAMGPGCETVKRGTTDQGKIEVIGTWPGGRRGVYREAADFRGLARGEKGEAPAGSFDG